MDTPLMPWRKVCFYALLSVTDLALTWLLINTGQGVIYESNPIADAWLSQYGWLGLACFKALCAGLVIVLSLLIALRLPRAGSGILTFACVATAAVNLYSLALFGYFAWHDSQLATYLRHPPAAVTATLTRPTNGPALRPPTTTVPHWKKQPPTVPPSASKSSHKPTVWLTTWPPQQEMFFNPLSPHGSGLLPSVGIDGVDVM